MGAGTSHKREVFYYRVVEGAAAQVCSQVVRIVIHFIEVPLFLYFWGIQLYGEWLILTAIPAYLTMTDVGFTNAARRDMAMLVARDDRQAALGVFQSIGLLVAALSMGISVVLLGLTVVLPLEELFHFKIVNTTTLQLLLGILYLYIILSLQSGLIYCGFYCEGYYGFGTFLETLIKLLEFALLVVGLILGGALVEVALALLIGRLIGIIGMILMLKRTVTWLHFGINHVSWFTIKRLIRPALASMAFPIGNSLNLQSIRLVIGAALGPAATTMFTTLRTLSRVAVQCFNSIGLIVEPELGRAYGQGDQDLFRRLFRHTCQVTLWVTGLGCLALWFLRDWLLLVWTAGKIPMDDLVFALLLLVGVVNSGWFTAMKVANATNRHGKMAIAYAVAYSACVLTAYSIVPIYGMSGVCIVLLITESLLMAYVLPQSLHLASDRWSPWVRTVVYPPWFLFSIPRKFVRNISNQRRGWNIKCE